MTREEAIQVLNMVEAHGVADTAKRMAIEALHREEAEANGWCHRIYPKPTARPKIKHDREWIMGCIQHDGFIHTHRFDEANQIILDALSARPTWEWIPCSERLPEDTTKPVLISGIHKGLGVYAVDIARYNGGMWQYDGFTFPDCDIIAWMPLPEPYKGGDDE